MHCLGFSQLKTNLEGGRQANICTMRASVIDVFEGAELCLIAADLATDGYTSTQFAGWSPNGENAIIGQFRRNPEAAKRDEERKGFNYTADDTLYDSWLVNFETDERVNVTAVERISFYNAGLKYWPDNPDKLTFQALINGRGHPVVMNIDGTGKVDLLKDRKGFSYGAVPSPDGTILVHQTEYKIHMEYDGERKLIDTGFNFNFGPSWSADGKWLAFVAGDSGETADNVIIVSRDGNAIRKLTDRGGYIGVTLFLDVPDYHGGSSDIPVWAPDGSCLYLTRKDGETHNIWKANLDGRLARLTKTKRGVHNYHPSVSPDGELICFGSDMSGTRQLHIMDKDGSNRYQLTHVPEHNAAMWASWRP